MSSFLVKVPIGSLLLLEGQIGDFNCRSICLTNTLQQQNDISEKCYYLLDGQQRLSTIYNIFNNITDTHLFDSLKYRWYLDFNNEILSSAFGLDNLNFTNNFSILEPNDIVEGIGYYKITSRGTNDVLNPYYDFGSKTENAKLRLIGSSLALESKLPLFDFFEGNRIAFITALEQIAEIRMKDIYESVIHGTISSAVFPHIVNLADNELEEELTEMKNIWIRNVEQYFIDLFKNPIHVPLIPSEELARATSIFENMNKGGTPLNAFDIMIAKFNNIRNNRSLADELNLTINESIDIPQSIYQTINQISDTYSPIQCNVLNKETVSNELKEFYLNLIALHSSEQYSIDTFKKDKILKISIAEVRRVIDNVNKSFIRTLAFIQYRLGIVKFTHFPYKLFLLPIAKILVDDDKFKNAVVINRIEKWYWTSLFSGRFREKQNSRVIEELSILQSISSNEFDLSDRIKNCFQETNYSNDDTLLLKNEDRSVTKSIHNGILQFLLMKGKVDIVDNDVKLLPWNLVGVELEDHHIIPLASATTINESTKALRREKKNMLNSPLNRLLITKNSNRLIGSKNISQYESSIEENTKNIYFIRDLTSTDLEIETKIKTRLENFKTHFFNHINGL